VRWSRCREPTTDSELWLEGEVRNRTEEALSAGARKRQSCVMRFSDGSVATFTGPAVVDSDEIIHVVGVFFTEPQNLLDDENFEEMTQWRAKERHEP